MSAVILQMPSRPMPPRPMPPPAPAKAPAPAQSLASAPTVTVAAAAPDLSPGYAFIDDALAKLAARPGFKTRPGQRDLINAIFEHLAIGRPLAVEAPTGTGKTLAYTIAGLAA